MLAATLADFQMAAQQCDRLIANAHRVDANGIPLLPAVDQQQITIAGLLNLFVAWESFLEDCLAKYMAGCPTISGRLPVRFVTPSSIDAAKLMVVGVNRYFDYGNHDYVRKMVRLYFDQGYPFEPHLTSIVTMLGDLRTMRNASAHVTSTTQAALEALAQRVHSIPQPGIALYALLVATDTRSTSGNTVYGEARDTLLAAASLIANG